MAFFQATKDGSASFRRIQIDQILNGIGINTRYAAKLSLLEMT
ncbi:hypothetical protein [Vibrio algicola]|nr:hypothetical protein [Vibrio algicola]